MASMARSIIDTPVILPSISGNAWITGNHQHAQDPQDLWPEGYRIGDTWPTGLG